MQRKKLVLCSTLAVALLLVLVPMVLAAPIVVYDATSSPLPPSIPSLGFQATQTSEFGDWVQLGGTNRALRTVTVTMVTWADHASNPSYPVASWSHPITLNIYNFVSGSPLNTVGSLLGTVTQNVTIPWRPPADPTCPTPTQWRFDAATCYSGFAFNITFDLSSLNLTLPDDIIVGIAYNTQTYGAAPIGVEGPYNSLNVGALGAATVGTDGSTDKVFWNTSTAGWYDDGGTGGVGIFREDTDWTPNGTVNIQIIADTPCTTDCYVDPTGNDANLGTSASPFLTVQKGIDTVASGGTVHIADGTYEEAVVIDAKTVTLQGESLAAIVKAPTSVPICTTTSYDWHPVICVKNSSTATIDTLTIDGAGRGNANYKFMGVAFRDSGGAVKNSVIDNIEDTPFSGAQHGVAVNLYNDDAASRTLDVLNNDISDFQKNAMAITTGGSSSLVVDIDGNNVQGKGTTDVTAQNGIQVYQSGGTLTGTITDNTVNGIGYDNTLDPTKWVATSILDFYADVDITGNTVTGAQVGVYFIEGSGDILNNDIDVDQIGNGGMWGVIATDPPDAVPSPFGGDDLLAETGDGPNAPSSTLTVDVSNNTVTFVGGSNTSTFGIEADAGYGADDLAVTANGNTVTGFEIGIEIWQCQASCAAGVFTSVVANTNCLYNNTYGMRSNASYITVNGENNWWGNATGPYNLAQNPTGTGNQVSDYIDFQPWTTGGCGGDWQNTTTMVYDDLQGSLDNAAPGEEIIFAGTGPVAGGATSNSDGVTINLNGGTFGPGSPFLTVNSANMTVVGPGTLDGNGSTDPAILVITGGDNFILDGVEVTDWADGVEVASSVTSFKLVNNWIHSNTDAGLQVDTGVSIGGVTTIQGNLFKVNGGNGVQNDSGNLLNATYNSWGDDAGPAGALGDGVSANVTVDPWTFAEVYIDVDPATPLDQYVRGVDESTSFNVDLNVDGENLYGLSFEFTYDPNFLTFDGPPSPTFVSPWAGNCSVVGTPPTGTFAYTCYLTSGPAFDGGTVATFSFTADGPSLTGDGPWTTYFDISADPADTNAAAVGGVKVFVNNAGYNDPSVPDRDIVDVNDGQINITGIAKFTGFVDVQGRANDSGAVVDVYNQLATSGATLLASGTSVSSGSYTTNYIPSNLLTVGTTYYFQVDRALYLPTTVKYPSLAATWAQSKVMTTRPLTSLATFVLLGGDATNDDIVDIFDGGCIGPAYGGGPVVCNVTGNSDVNGDGVTNILDLVLFGGNYTLTASPWTP